MRYGLSKRSGPLAAEKTAAGPNEKNITVARLSSRASRAQKQANVTWAAMRKGLQEEASGFSTPNWAEEVYTTAIERVTSAGYLSMRIGFPAVSLST